MIFVDFNIKKSKRIKKIYIIKKCQLNNTSNKKHKIEIKEEICFWNVIGTKSYNEEGFISAGWTPFWRFGEVISNRLYDPEPGGVSTVPASTNHKIWVKEQIEKPRQAGNLGNRAELHDLTLVNPKGSPWNLRVNLPPPPIPPITRERFPLDNRFSEAQSLASAISPNPLTCRQNDVEENIVKSLAAEIVISVILVSWLFIISFEDWEPK